MKNILVLCTGNSCRSQMAHGYLQTFAQGHAKIYSAGIQTHGVNPLAIKVMQEDGIDISHHVSHHINEYKDINFDVIITVCDHAAENCPVFPSHAQKIHHNFSDPSKVQGSETQVLSAFREVRDQIKLFCTTFIAQWLNV